MKKIIPTLLCSLSVFSFSSSAYEEVDIFLSYLNKEQYPIGKVMEDIKEIKKEECDYAITLDELKKISFEDKDFVVLLKMETEKDDKYREFLLSSYGKCD
jgi:hypothetical protein